MSDLTKKALSRTLRNLLEEIPLSKVTVALVTKECGVNRQTFYYHFRDIPDLVGWTFTQEAKETFAEFKDKNVSWEEGFLALFDLLLRDKRFILNVYHSVSLEILQDYIYLLAYPSLLEAIERSPKNAFLSKEEKVFAADFYKYALSGIVLNWIKGGMRQDPKQVASMTFEMFKKHPDIELTMEVNKLYERIP